MSNQMSNLQIFCNQRDDRSISMYSMHNDVEIFSICLCCIVNLILKRRHQHDFSLSTSSSSAFEFFFDDRQEGNTTFFLPLHIPDPLSTTRAATSSSSLILKYKLLLLLLKK
jgi:hypothetical protein